MNGTDTAYPYWLTSTASSASSTATPARIAGRCDRTDPPPTRPRGVFKRTLGAPLGQEQVRLAAHLAAAIRGEHEVAAVGAEHRESVELGIGSHGRGLPAGHAHEVEVEVPPPRVLPVRGDAG